MGLGGTYGLGVFLRVRVCTLYLLKVEKSLLSAKMVLCLFYFQTFQFKVIIVYLRLIF
jgi:hypothetical protein